MKKFASTTLAMLLMSGALAGQVNAEPLHKAFVFGQNLKLAGDAKVVSTADLYTPAAGYGFEGTPPSIDKTSAEDAPFFFSFDVPEGNYFVNVALGGDAASDTTVKAELRRLMVEPVVLPANGAWATGFIVNVRTPALPDGTSVKLKAPRESDSEARAWDQRITLEFDGTHPAVRSISVQAVNVPVIYILGDSTSCDQSGEPYASWGQMFPDFFKPTVGIANHGESGETVDDSNSRGRFAKIMSLIKPGDYVIVQFGHNDMKEKAKDPDAAKKYKAALIDWARQIKAKGAIPVIVTSMNRHTFENGVVVNSLEEYPQMAREAAAETDSPLIDLNAQSKILYETLGEKPSLALFEHTADYSQKDATHHSPYGAYELAKIIVQGLRDDHLPIAAQIKDGLPAFDPAHPDSEASFTVPPSVTFAAAKPLGN